jgi:hypothetical protein
VQIELGHQLSLAEKFNVYTRHPERG